MARLIVGAALMPTAALMLWMAGRAVGSLAGHAHSAWPFLGGIFAVAVSWLFRRFVVPDAGGVVGWLASLSSRGYILGHELTHALAAWSVGAKVMDFKVAQDHGHVDLSRSNAFIALAPYCVPIYALGVVLGYRALLFAAPGSGGRVAFLALMGAAIAFHAIKTCEALWDQKQPDLPAAGGVVFSLSWILMFNGLVLLLLLKALFPAAVDLSGSFKGVTSRTLEFWRSLYAVFEPLRHSFVAQLKGS